MVDSRKQKRTPIRHPVVYTGINAEGTIENQGIGVAIDISPDGMMVETTEPIHSKVVKFKASISKSVHVETIGEMVYSLPHAPNKYRTGFTFSEPVGQRSQFADNILELY